ncbi:MAG: hypothetical protein FWG47_04145 [Propionibacteriaceae bacterium]|nr:hypothetical protein [Propionibacteriaceae bacterium]
MRNKITSGVLLIVCALALPFFSGCSLGVDVNKELQNASETINATCPMMVDAETQLDNTEVADKMLIYNYTMINFAKADLTDEQLTQVKATMQRDLLNLIKSSPEMKVFRDFGVSLKYVYRSSDALELFSLTFTPEDYA